MVSPRTVYVRIIIVVINVKIRHPKGFRLLGDLTHSSLFATIIIITSTRKRVLDSLHGISKKLLEIVSHRKCRYLT